jgi:hypothetical protein
LPIRGVPCSWQGCAVSILRQTSLFPIHWSGLDRSFAILRWRPPASELNDIVRLTVFVTDMKVHRPIVNQVQTEVWGAGP